MPVLKILFTITLKAIFPVSAGHIDCNHWPSWENQINGNSSEECQKLVDTFSKSCDPNTISTTAGAVNRSNAELLCLKNVMNRELDKRLIPLKKKDPLRFKDEMRLQRAFNIASTKSCGIYNNCQGTLWKMSAAACHVAITRWRLEQVNAINLNSLSLKAAAHPSDEKLASLVELQNFGELICKLPRTVFKDGQLPPNCKNAVIASFASTLGEDCAVAEKDL